MKKHKALSRIFSVPYGSEPSVLTINSMRFIEFYSDGSLGNYVQKRSFSFTLDKLYIRPIALPYLIGDDGSRLDINIPQD